ncbi:DEAD/DEAH box helicase [Candidatus Bipolaricaulota bacterium]
MSLESVSLRPELKASYEKLVRSSVEPFLPGQSAHSPPAPSILDIRALLAFTSHLCLSETPEVRNLALEILSKVAELLPSDATGMGEIVCQLLSRLGNFPAIGVVEQRFGSLGTSKLGISLALERMSRRVENSISLGESVLGLTDFQAELISALRDRFAVSVSAPTSAGKSFAFLAEIVRNAKLGLQLQSAYIVPTRALIRQVAQALRGMLRATDSPDIPVRCIPVPLDVSATPNGAVYVLTQERLLSLLHSDIGQATLNALYVDESQGIGTSAGARGVLLQSVIDEVRFRFPQCTIRMAGPMIRNPEYLLSLFEIDEMGSVVSSEEPPVSQNLFRVTPLPGKDPVASFELLQDGGHSIDLGERRLERKVGMDSGSLARFALALPRSRGCTLLYANKPHLAEVLALKLAASLPAPPDGSGGEIERFHEFLKDHVHPEYSLAKCIRHRAAFHHGSMPSVVREGVEELVQQGKLDFICCTSTLLQGVNLPAKDIIIAKPQKGQNTPMRREDFLNLVGRAGRLTKELQGNVWCLDPNSWDAADGEPLGCLRGEKLHDVKSALEAVMEDGGSLIGQLIDGDVKAKDEGLASAALAKIYTDYIEPGIPLAETLFASEENRETLRQLDAQIHRTAVVTLPREILQRNSGIVPFRLEELYQSMREKPHLASWYPMVPRARDQESYESLKRIFRILERRLAHSPGQSYKFDTWLATQWIRNRPLREIIEKRLNHARKSTPKVRPSSVIRRVIDDIESRIRYRAVKHFKAYCDILWLVAKERNRDAKLPPGVRHFYLFLECGASDEGVLNLIGLGLSRTTALLLRPHLPDTASLNPEMCLRLLRDMNLASLKLPWTVRQEVVALIG